MKHIELVKVKAKNVFSYEEIEVPLNEFSVLQIIGKNLDERFEGEEDENGIYPSSNGTGKTSIYNIITEALYSKNLSRIKKTFIKNIDSKIGFNITLYLKINGEDHKLVYTSNECKLYKGDNIIVTGRKAVTGYFEEILPYDLFVALTYMSPKYKLPFFSETDKYRKEFINKCFSDLNVYLEPANALTEYGKEINGKLIGLNQYRAMLEKELNEPIYPEKEEIPCQAPIKDTKKEYELRKIIEEAEEKINVYNKEKYLYDDLIRQQKSLTVKEVLPVFNYDEYNQIKYKINELKNEKEKLLKIEEYATCPTCGAKLDKEKTKERIIDITTKLSNYVYIFNEMTAIKNKYEEVNKKLEKLREVNEKLNSFNFTYSEEEIKKLEREKTNAENDLEKLEKEYQKKYDEYLKIREENLKIRAWNNEQRLKKKRKEEVKQKLKELDEEKNMLNKEIAYIKVLQEVFSPKGLFAYKLPERLELLNEQVNSILLNLTSQFQIVFKVIKEKIEVFLLKNGKEYPVENCSEGEYTRISLALLLALRHILSISQGLKLNILFLDEIFGSLDLLGRAKLFDIMKDFNLNVLLVSHSSFYFELPTLEVIKEKGKSKAILYKP